MDISAYKELSELQKKHWWFRARTNIISAVLSKYVKKSETRQIIEIGCGAGGNISLLKEFGHVSGLEMEPSVAEYAKKNTYADIRIGHMPDNIPFNNKFDIACMLDVLEHIENDKEAVSAVHTMLSDKGLFVLTVPAYNWLYGKHDKILHHKRRYTKDVLIKLLSDNGFEILNASYFNTLLFPLVAAARVFEKIVNSSGQAIGFQTPADPINFFLYSVFSLEAGMLSKISLPFGASLIIISRKK